MTDEFAVRVDVLFRVLELGLQCATYRVQHDLDMKEKAHAIADSRPSMRIATRRPVLASTL